MKPLQDLFDLVQTLTASEKRYLSTHLKGDTQINQLLQRLMRETELEVEPIQSDMGYADNYPGFLRITRYLEERVLNLLKGYDFRNSDNAYITEAVQNIEVLYRRGFYDKALRVVAQVKKKAYSLEKFELLLELIRWQHRLIMTSMELDEQLKALKVIYEEQQKVVDVLQNINQYVLLEQEVLIRFRKEYMSRDKNNTLKFEDLLLTSPEYAYSVRARYYYHMMRGMMYFYNNEFENSILEYETLYNYLKLNDFFMESYPEEFMGCLIAWTRGTCWKGDADGTIRLLNYIEQHPVWRLIPEARQYQFQQMLYNFALIVYLDNRRLEDALKLVEPITDLMNNQRAKMDPLHYDLFHYNFGILYEELGDYVRARKHLNLILEKPIKNVRDDLYVFSMILELLVLYDMQDWELLDYRLKRTYRFLRSRKRIYKFESLIMDFIRQLSRSQGPAELKKHFIKLRDEIEALKKVPFEQNATKYFTFTEWLEERIARLG